MSFIINPYRFGGGVVPDFDYTNLFSRIRAEGLTNSGAPLNNDDPIPQADDISGNGNHWGQGTAGQRPIYKTNQVNGKAAIRFNSANSTHFGGPFFDSLTECEFFIVLKVDADPAASGGSSGSWRLNSADNVSSASTYPFTDSIIYEGAFIEIPTSARASVNPTPSLSSAWRLYNVQAQAGTNNYIMRLDGTAIVTTTKTLEFSASLNGAIGRSQGTSGSNFMNGLVAEFFFLSAAAGASQRTSIKDYINSYYGLSTV